MYVSQINPTTNFGCAKMLTKTPKLMNRSMLQKASSLKNLDGPAEMKKAEEIISTCASMSGSTAFVGAQCLGGEEVLITAVDMGMAAKIINGVYKFNLTKTAIQSVLTGVRSKLIGSYATKFASKFLTWIPGPGNLINCAIASSTTLLLGKAIVDWCEDEDKKRKIQNEIIKILKKP